jgi:outer membrane protein TolC
MSLDLYVFNAGTSSDPYNAVKIDLEKAKNSAANTKKQLADSTRALYYNIKQLEDQYEVLQTNLTKAEDSLKVLRLRYDLGMATESELLDAEYQAAQLKNNLYSLAIQHEQLKTAFAMPWVLGA